MRSNCLQKTSVALAVFVLTTAALPALASDPGEFVVAVRATSLEAVAADLTELGFPVEVDEILGSLGFLGLPDASWVDTGRPIAVGMPPAGLMLGAKGFVAVLPAKEPMAAARTLMGGEVGEPDADGLYSFSLGEAGYAVKVADGYLVISANRDIVKAVDPSTAEPDAGLPASHLWLDVQVEQLAPMLLMGLQMAQQQVGQMKEELGDAAVEDPFSEKFATDIVLQAFKDLINNTSRLQIGLEMTADHAVLHSRLTPKVGSTLAGIVAAQEGGFPEAARFIDPEGGFFVSTGQIRQTEASIEAMKFYMSRAMSIFDEVAMDMDDPAFGQWMSSFYGSFYRMSDTWLECARGDSAAVVALDADGMRMTQVAGVRDADGCEDRIREVSQLPPIKDAEGNAMIEIDTEKLEIRGVPTTRVEIELGGLLPEDSGADAEALGTLFGDSMVAYSAVTGGYSVITFGADADERFAGLLDTMAGKSQATGITGDWFAPFEAGPGFYASIDFAGIGALFPIGEDDAVANEIRDVFAGLGRMVYGLGFSGDSIDASFAMPKSTIETFKRMVTDKAAEVVAPSEEEEEQSQG